MTKPEYDWNTDYALETRFKIDEGPWTVILTFSDEQSAMDEMQRRIKKHGNQTEYRVMQRHEVQMSMPNEPRAKQETLKSLLITLDEAENYIKKFRKHLQGEYDES